MSGIALVYPDATLTPSKLELVRAWLPRQGWFQGTEAADAAIVGSYRFVDPDGEVGIETFLVRSEGTVYQVPVTYRGEPLDDGEDFLVGEMEHSLLGHRWVYDAVGDPAYIDTLITVIREADNEAEVSTGAPKTVTVEGSGVIPLAHSTGQLKLCRVVDPVPEKQSTRTATGELSGTWSLDGETRTTTLATLY